MRKTLTAFVLALIAALSCTACGAPSSPSGDDTIRIAATTYPVYLFTTAVTEGAEGIQVELMIQQTTSCLHDYTLTVNDMKVVESADILIMNGGGLEDFLSDALSASSAAVIDCSVGIPLLDSHGHDHDHTGGHDHGHDHDHTGGHDHGHDHEDDPHFWMSTEWAAVMLQNICAGLSQIDPDNATLYESNLQASLEMIPQNTLRTTSSIRPHLITFHDGFRYFAQDSHMVLLKSIEEEEGAEASSADIKEIIELIRTHDIPAIFTEVNGSQSTAQAIARETGVEVYALNLLMSGGGSGMQPYVDAMTENYATIVQALGVH